MCWGMRERKRNKPTSWVLSAIHPEAMVEEVAAKVKEKNHLTKVPLSPS